MFDFPTITDFKNFFIRGFPFGNDPTQNITDADIGIAFQQAQVNINMGLWSTQGQFNIAFFYLAAHYLVVDYQMAVTGVSGVGTWLTTSKSVGNVAEAYQIPQRILDNPELGLYGQTKYGLKYLSLILPRLVGQIFSVQGATRA